ncbi:MAG: dihydrolipoyl dehydrogenase [Deltaproteobacteria bacterium]|nr:dihydrolipoyl dehydrogenase [Deltaproteobacteria bacterium]
MSTEIAVLGGGPGGYVAAVRAAQRGARVTLIEKDSLGGTCLNRGCIPSKIMQTTSGMLERFRNSSDFGIRLEGQAVADMAALQARKKKIVANQVRGIGNLLKHNGITHIEGRGIVQGHGTLEALTAEGETRSVPWEKLIVATGSEPLEIAAFPFDGVKVISSTDVLNLDRVPESMIIVGGGVIGCEFACILADLGTRVTVVEALDRLLPLPSVDAGCSKVLQREMKKRKITFFLDKTVTAVDTGGEKAAVTIGPSPRAADLKEKDRQPLELEVEKVLVCIGRQSNAAGIGLETLGLELDEKGWITADNRMQTSVDTVFAIGDALGPAKVMLAHVASTEGIVAAENATGGDRQMDYTAVPGAIFTSPEVANVGLTEAQAGERNLDYRADTVLFRTVGKAQVIGELAGEAKIVSDTASGRVLGVHIIGAHATDLIAEGTLAVTTGRTVQELAETIHAHPTLAEVTMEAAFKAVGRALHG